MPLFLVVLRCREVLRILEDGPLLPPALGLRCASRFWRTLWLLLGSVLARELLLRFVRADLNLNLKHRAVVRRMPR